MYPIPANATRIRYLEINGDGAYINTGVAPQNSPSATIRAQYLGTSQSSAQTTPLFGNAGTGDFVLGPDTFQQGVVPTRMMPMGVRRKQAGPQIPYVTDGLVAWWDGAWNAGLGVHDAAATVWRDLIGTYAMTASASTDTWGDAYLNMGTTTWDVAPKQQFAHLINSPQRVGEGYSVEMVLSHTHQGSKLIFGQAYISLDIHALGVREQAWVKSGTNIDIGPTSGGLHSISITSARVGSTGDQSQRWYYNGANAQSATRTFVKLVNPDSRGIGIGHGEYPERGIATARIYCIRLYSRVITDAEVAANYAIDKARFKLP